MRTRSSSLTPQGQRPTPPDGCGRQAGREPLRDPAAGLPQHASASSRLTSVPERIYATAISKAPEELPFEALKDPAVLPATQVFSALKLNNFSEADLRVAFNATDRNDSDDIDREEMIAIFREALALNHDNHSN